MPGIVMDGIHEDVIVNEDENSNNCKQNSEVSNSHAAGQTAEAPHNGDGGENVEEGAETSIEQLFENMCEMQSSDQSPSRHSFGYDGDESQIDSELQHLVGGETREVEIIQEDEEVKMLENGDYDSDSGSNRDCSSTEKMENSLSVDVITFTAESKKAPHLQLDSDISGKSSPKSKSSTKPPKSSRKTFPGV